MPLIDDHDVQKNYDLTKSFWQYFKPNRSGEIFDNYGNNWILFDENQFSIWLRQFESLIGTPIGRIIHNSATDCAEIVLSNIKSLKFKFFARKRLTKLLVERWKNFGWGKPFFTDNKIETKVFPSVATGFYLASKEIVDCCRYKIEWSQKSASVIHCIITEGNNSMSSPAAINIFPWTKSLSSNNPFPKKSFYLEQRELGWSIEGNINFMIPSEMINRTVSYASGYIKSLDSKLSKSWIITGFHERHSNSIICALETSKKLFLDGDDYIYLKDNNDWYSISNKYLESYGLISISECTQEDGFTILILPASPTFILCAGKLVGIWERAHGKVAKCKISASQDQIKLELSSLHDYSSAT